MGGWRRNNGAFTLVCVGRALQFMRDAAAGACAYDVLSAAAVSESRVAARTRGRERRYSSTASVPIACGSAAGRQLCFAGSDVQQQEGTPGLMPHIECRSHTHLHAQCRPFSLCAFPAHTTTHTHITRRSPHVHTHARTCVLCRRRHLGIRHQSIAAAARRPHQPHVAEARVHLCEVRGHVDRWVGVTAALKHRAGGRRELKRTGAIATGTGYMGTRTHGCRVSWGR